MILMKSDEPNHGLTLDDLDRRLSQEMGRCAQDYQEARDDQDQLHGDLKKKYQETEQEIQALRPGLERMIEGNAGLSQGMAQRAERYLELLEQQKKNSRGRRLARPAGS